ncbi:MAG: hypothetical protein L0323_20145 [Planctomycetes bacterium]|nr:hypothetical protein [Planctomycetota bacterium]
MARLPALLPRRLLLAAVPISAPAPALAQSIVFAENFEGGGLGAYVETDPSGSPAATLWHGEPFCVGPNGSYTAVPTAPPVTFPSIAGLPGAITILGPLLDDAVVTIPVPIPFSLNGSPVATLNVDTNGPVSAGAFSDFSNDRIPSTAAPNGWTAAWWDDLFVTPAGAVRGAIVGGSVVLEWTGLEHFPGNGSGETATFQVRLDPSPANTIALLYDGATFSLGTDPWSATIGIENATGLAGLDPTGLGAANSAFPATNFLLVPSASNPGTPLPASMGTGAAAYNRGDLGIYDYDTGGTNAGAIESPAISTPAGAAVTLAFDTSRDTEPGTGFDQSFVDVRPAGGQWASLIQVSSLTPCSTPTTVSTPVLGVGGAPWQHRFRFDTIGPAANAYLGWVVDNVSVSASGTGPSVRTLHAIAPASTTTTVAVEEGPPNGAAGLFFSTAAGPPLPILPSSPEPVWLDLSQTSFLVPIPLDSSGDGSVSFTYPTPNATFGIYFQCALVPGLVLTSASGTAQADLGGGQAAVLAYRIKTGVVRVDAIANPGLDLDLERVAPGGAVTNLGTATVGATGTVVLQTTLVPPLASGETLQLVVANAVVAELSLQ